MGAEVSAQSYTREERQRYREKVRQNLDVFERMLTQHSFEFERPMTGLEIELNLVNGDYDPHFANAEVLHAIADPGYQTELAQYNIELNVPPRPLPGDSALELERDLRQSLNDADAKAREVGSRLVTIGILPTIMPEHYEGEWISDNNRYTALNDSIFVARGEDIYLDIHGPYGERVATYCDSIAPESACTSVQLHLQVAPADFADHWNAAQALSPVQVALAANSPFFFGQRLHAETRIELFKQATDTRPIELKNQGVRPRVFFGERWITSIFDLFEENSLYFPALLAETTDEDPMARLEAGEAPDLAELRLHNGTVYRWNRPIYDIVNGRPHLRVENRVLPAGPTIADTLANAAFYYGAIRKLAGTERPVWTKMSFAACEENFERAARDGIDARLYWPGFGQVGADELVLRHLLPLAHQGLEEWGVSQAVRERFLGIIEARCQAGVNGATWQTDAVQRFEDKGSDRRTALHQMLELYAEHMGTNEPVHTWPLP
ncbi:glutamate-cysteine ligase family protein [Knoellia subterranea]|uniref:Glutamate--cysteine ligase n=1 Tax=Knoellia subterranea KCTC 19937 TaxID=1385521 RepID=A0A0A0JRG6_9MICO|nr:glutamate-cysteine ligase family protein [Knoellia subterranea]KGN38642.1 glutamate--cysteine ligase [Knoellia subterranea KCTC 19937]